MTKTIEATWQLLQQHQGETFHTAKGLPFTYTIRGGALFVNRRRKSITVSTVRRALEKITLLEAAGEVITGPKKIGCYGASYLYPGAVGAGRSGRTSPAGAGRIYRCRNCERDMKSVQNAPHT